MIARLDFQAHLPFSEIHLPSGGYFHSQVSSRFTGALLAFELGRVSELNRISCCTTPTSALLKKIHQPSGARL